MTLRHLFWKSQVGRQFGEGGTMAVKKEMQQLHDQKVMKLVTKKELTPE